MDKVFKEFSDRGEKPLVNNVENGEICWEYWYKEVKYTYYFYPNNDFYYLLVTDSNGKIEEALYKKSFDINYIRD